MTGNINIFFYIYTVDVNIYNCLHQYTSVFSCPLLQLSTFILSNFFLGKTFPQERDA